VGAVGAESPLQLPLSTFRAPHGGCFQTEGSALAAAHDQPTIIIPTAFGEQNGMTAAFEPTGQRDLAPVTAMSAKVKTVKAPWENLWPAIMIGGGIVLTVIWNVSLLWLFVLMILTLL
jgi:hypothetical protein